METGLPAEKNIQNKFHDAATNREYELVLWGATGYTGKITAEYITKSLPHGLKWAIAGRNARKLNELSSRLETLNPSRITPDIITANLDDEELDRLAKRARLIISTVGPYHIYGAVVFGACARNGTHYLDCTGESFWVADMIRDYDETAKKSGSIMISNCGFDCVPSEILTWVAADCIRQQFSAPIGRIDVCVHNVQFTISGGTLASFINALDHYSLRQLYDIHRPFAMSPRRPNPTVPVRSSSMWTKAFGLLRIPELGWMGYEPQGPIDRAIVHRSWGLLESTPERYGPNFDFHAWFRIWGPVFAVFWHLGLALLAGLFLLRPVRRLLSQFWYQPGTGADLETTKNYSFEHRAVAEVDIPHSASGSKQEKAKVLARMRFDRDPYFFTGVALGEAAMLILRGRDTQAHSLGGGVMTPATLGEKYVDRLREAGLNIEARVKSSKEQGEKSWFGKE